MSRRVTGVLFIAIAAFLYAARFVAAAIWGAGVTNWNTQLFSNMYDYIGNGLTIWSILALLVGAGYLIWAEISE